MSHSEIRPSQISALLDKVRKHNYEKYLRAVRLTKIRGFSGGEVGFDFPVTALVGPNGGGKSTVLGAASCAYKEIKPGTFFPKSSIGDNSMADWSLEYDIVDKSISSSTLVRRSSSFRQLKWVRGDVVSRPVAHFGISRTVPAGERPHFKKLMKPSYSHSSPLEALPATAAEEIEHILGRSVKDFRRTDVGSNDRFHVGKYKGNEYSEFHFGAGESSIIRIVTEIELLPESSLILIEEIENGLHPVATRRLVEYLISAAERRRIQAIFTTHSDDALEILPREAVWSCFDGIVQQGKLSVRTLRAMSGKVETALAIFTEDDFARFVVEAVIREFLPDAYDQLEVHALSGDGNAVRVHRTRQVDPSTKFKSICVLDGDSREKDDTAERIYRLPGKQPESEVFNGVTSNLQENIAILTVSLQLDPTRQAEVKRACEEIASSNRDPHLIFNQLGIVLGFIPEDVVRGAFVNMWIRSNRAQFAELISAINDEINLFDQGRKTNRRL